MCGLSMLGRAFETIVLKLISSSVDDFCLSFLTFLKVRVYVSENINF